MKIYEASPYATSEWASLKNTSSMDSCYSVCIVSHFQASSLKVFPCLVFIDCQLKIGALLLQFKLVKVLQWAGPRIQYKLSVSTRSRLCPKLLSSLKGQRDCCFQAPKFCHFLGPPNAQSPLLTFFNSLLRYLWALRKQLLPNFETSTNLLS